MLGSLPFLPRPNLWSGPCHYRQKACAAKRAAAPVPARPISPILKLLAKSAEERYQTGPAWSATSGASCAWETQNRIDASRWANRQGQTGFVIPRNCMGESASTRALFAAFDRVVSAGRTELL